MKPLLVSADVDHRSFPATLVYFACKGGDHVKGRKRQRDNRRQKKKEEFLERKNFCGVKDLTACNAVRQIVTEGKAAILL